MLQPQILGTSLQFSANLHSSDLSSWLWFDGLAITILPGSLSQAFCLFHNTGSVFCPSLSAHGFLHVVRFGEQKNSTPFIKKLLLLQTIFLALTPKFKVTEILQVNPYWLFIIQCFFPLASVPNVPWFSSLKHILNEHFTLHIKKMYEQLNWKVISEISSACSKICTTFLSYSLFPLLKIYFYLDIL